MANAKISALTALTTASTDDLFAVVDDPSGSPVTKKITLSNLNSSLGAIGQIPFPATQSASANANTLDDYEEGTFVPGMTFGGSATSVAGTFSGRYIVIGQLVMFQISITLTNNGTGTGAALITGLPFAELGTGAWPVKFSLWSNLSLTTSGGSLIGHVTASGTTITMHETTGTAASAAVTDTNIPNTASFRVSGHYAKAT